MLHYLLTNIFYEHLKILQSLVRVSQSRKLITYMSIVIFSYLKIYYPHWSDALISCWRICAITIWFIALQFKRDLLRHFFPGAKRPVKVFNAQRHQNPFIFELQKYFLFWHFNYPDLIFSLEILIHSNLISIILRLNFIKNIQGLSVCFAIYFKAIPKLDQRWGIILVFGLLWRGIDLNFSLFFGNIGAVFTFFVAIAISGISDLPSDLRHNFLFNYL